MEGNRLEFIDGLWWKRIHGLLFLADCEKEHARKGDDPFLKPKVDPDAEKTFYRLLANETSS